MNGEGWGSSHIDREQRIAELEYALRQIDTHIRSTKKPVPHIVEELKRVLPEYKEEN